MFIMTSDLCRITLQELPDESKRSKIHSLSLVILRIDILRRICYTIHGRRGGSLLSLNMLSKRTWDNFHRSVSSDPVCAFDSRKGDYDEEIYSFF